MTQQIFWFVIMGLQLGLFLGVGGIVVWIFRVGKWMGGMENEKIQNRQDHLRFDKDLRHAHERIDSLPAR